jgi:hypothetical protein|tara:strand:+ start:2393 stop:2614 length:222 start_codon:yes stop_codon:yes gene_type:complete
MAEKKTTPITIDDKDYILEDMSETQQLILSHVSDLERKIKSAQFNLEQLQVGREAFLIHLRNDLKVKDEAAAE